MTDKSSSRGRTLLIVVAACVAIASLVTAWRLFDRGSPENEPDGEMALIAEVVDNRVVVGRLTMHLSPSAAGENELWVELSAAPSGPLADANEIEVDFISHTFDNFVQTFELELDGEGVSESVSVDLDDQQFVQADFRVPKSGLTLPAATFVFLIPDPNIHGMAAVENVESDPVAEALYRRSMDMLTSLHRIRYVQPLTDGISGAVVSYHDINDGSDGTPAGFTYFTPGGLDAVVIEDQLWSRTHGEPWTVRAASPFIPPSEWDEEYDGATGFQLGPKLELASGRCQVVTFVTPEVERRAVAWYSWCIDEETGYTLRDAMIARNHYMITDYSEFDGDIVIVAPELADATPVARS